MKRKNRVCIFFAGVFLFVAPHWGMSEVRDEKGNTNVLSVTEAQQQGGKVTGKVVDELGPVIGATISVKGQTQHGTVSDVNGNFSLDGVKQGAVLVVSFVGYATQEITYNGQGTLNIQLKEDTLNLDEVLVVAYGTTTKASFTGSASVVKSDQIGKIAAAGVMESLQGMTAGVNITNNEGNPGSTTRVQIRGIANMRTGDASATNPLYVVDGVPYDGNINSIAPSDIETMTILKDAAAASLYGSRAANGVVVITTKRGKTGKAVVNFKAAWGTSDNAVKNPTKADPYQTMLNLWTANYNDGVYLRGMSSQDAGDYATGLGISQTVAGKTNSSGVTIYPSPFKSVPIDQYIFHDGKGNPYVNPNLEMIWDKSDYDFYGAVFSRKLRQDYNIDVSGATQDNKTNYYFSVSHLNDQGYSISQYYKRYSFRSNATSEINDWLTMGGNLAYSYARQKSGGSNRMLVFSNTLNSPWLRNADNTDWEYSLKTGSRMRDQGVNVAEYFGMHAFDAGYGGQGDYWADNPDDLSFENDEFGMLTAHYFAEFKLPFNVKFKTNVNLDDITRNHYSYASAIYGPMNGEKIPLPPYGITVLTEGGNASRQGWKTTSLTWNNLLTWEKQLGDHSLNLLAGHEFYSRTESYMMGRGSGTMLLGLYETTSTTKDWRADSSHDQYTLLSFLGRAEYNYKNKYYLSGSVRSDASSRFHPDQRWGSFFSAGASWRLSQEDFLSDVSWLNNLSLRGSYGTSGNDNIGVLYAYQEYYGPNNLYGLSGYRKTTNAADNLHWEQNKQFNVAADFSIFDRFSGTIEYYSRNSIDLLAQRDLPPSANAGAGVINTNLGDIVNRGFELSASAVAIQNKDFLWTINANFTTLHNEITSMAGGDYIYGISRSNYKRAVGHSLVEHFLPKTAGVNPDNGKMRYWIQDGNNNWSTTENWGDVNLERDGQFVGSAIPKGFGSITNSFSYKGFDFSFMWYGSYGAKMFSYQLRENSFVRAGVSVVPDIVDGKVWKKPGDQAQFARWSMSDASISGGNTISDQFLFSNDFLRLRNLTIGYTIPKAALKKIGFSNVRIYLTGDNLLTFSPSAKYFVDPESGVYANDYNGNGDNDSGIQGSRRVFMGGIQVSF
jgi:TonB-linked SusC/RagA family outer membrane protein